MKSDEYVEAVKKDFALKVKKCRNKAGLTQKEASKIIGMEPRYYQRLEAGQTNPTLSTIIKLQSGLNIFGEMTGSNETTAASLVPNSCIIDGRGHILSYNNPWARFAEENGMADEVDFLKMNYLDIARRAADSGVMAAEEFLVKFVEMKKTKSSGFHLDYTCHAPFEKRWYQVFVSRHSLKNSVYYLVNHIRVG